MLYKLGQRSQDEIPVLVGGNIARSNCARHTHGIINPKFDILVILRDSMPEFECPHPDCEDSEKKFDSEGGMKTHYGIKHEGSLAKEETTCSADRCMTEFEYYPSQTSGVLCSSCLNDNTVNISDFVDKRDEIDAESELRECPECGDFNQIPPSEVEENDTSFCDGDCYDKYRSQNKGIEVHCDECGDTKTVDKYSYKKYQNHYCSPECQHKGLQKKKVEIECTNCESTKKKYPSYTAGVDKHFCSKQCRNDYREFRSKEEVECCHCGVIFPKWERDVELSDKDFCTRDCRYEFFSSGEFNHDAYGRGFSEMKRKVRERDDYKCQICGKDKDKLGRHPSVHHITPVKWFVENRNYDKRDAHYEENGILLCEKHHNKVEWNKIDLKENIADNLKDQLELENPQ